MVLVEGCLAECAVLIVRLFAPQSGQTTFAGTAWTGEQRLTWCTGMLLRICSGSVLLWLSLVARLHLQWMLHYQTIKHLGRYSSSAHHEPR